MVRGRRRSEDLKEQHYQKMADMRLRRYTQTQIAEELGISQKQVSDDLKVLRRQWKAKQEAATDEMISEHIETLEFLMHEALKAWQHSVTPKELITHETGITPKGEIDKTIIRKDPGSGNSAFLQQAASLLDRIAALKGLPGHVEYGDINRAIETVKKAGLKIDEE